MALGYVRLLQLFKARSRGNERQSLILAWLHRLFSGGRIIQEGIVADCHQVAGRRSLGLLLQHTLICSIHSTGQVEPARLAGFRQHGISDTRPRRGLAIGLWVHRPARDTRRGNRRSGAGEPLGNELHHIYFIIQQCQISYSGLQPVSSHSAHDRTGWWRSIAGMIQMRSNVDGIKYCAHPTFPYSPVSLPSGRGEAGSYPHPALKLGS